MISIIVPIYNREKTIGRCIESIVNQTFQDLEILLVDDGSSDGSVEVCKKYAEIDTRIRVLQKKNGGVSSARNEGIRHAQGEYIQFVDSDDYIEPDMSRKLYEALKKYNAQVAVCGFREKFSKEQEDIVRQPSEEVVTEVRYMEKYVDGLFENCYIQCCWNKLYEKKYIQHTFREDYTYGEDLLYNLEYLEKIERVVFVPESLYIYEHTEGESLTSKYRKDEIDLRIRLMKRTFYFCDTYLEGEKSESEFASKMMRAIIYSLFDIYLDERFSDQERKQIVTSYIKNETVQKASKICILGNRQQKICNALIKKKKTELLLLFFRIKKTLHLYHN